jgi:hypothetical protein
MNIYKESIRRAAARLNREVFIGRGAHSGELYFLTPEQYLHTHTHVIGPPGMGKSKVVRGTLLRGYSDLDTPTALLESHGEECNQYLQFLQTNPRLLREGRIVHFKPGSDAEPIGINPFASSLPAPDIASLVLDALLKVWGADSFNEAPRMQRILRRVFHIAAVHQLWWDDVFQLLLPGNKGLRLNLLEGVQDETVRQEGVDFEALPLSIKQERFESSSNRIQKIICATSATMKAFRKQEKILDVRSMLRLRQSFVGDLSLLGSPEAESIVGAITVNMLYHAVKNRPESQRDFMVFAIDEFPQFVTTDIARSLDQFRKFGVHLILAHQRLDQLPPDLQSAVLNCAKIRFVFGGLSYKDAEILARELFAGEVRGDRIKYRNFQTKFRPILTQKEVESFSESESSSEGDSSGSQDSNSYGYGDSHGSTWNGDDETLHHALSSSQGSGRSSSAGHSSSSASASGRTRSYPWVTEHKEFQEESTPTYWSLDEQWETLTARTMNLEKREVLVKVYNQPVLDIRTPDVEIRPTYRRRKTACQRRLAELRRKQAREKDKKPIEGTILPLQSEGDVPEDFWE